jgi:hypothetical protein
VLTSICATATRNMCLPANGHPRRLGDHLLLALAIASGAVAAIAVPADDQRIADELIATDQCNRMRPSPIAPVRHGSGHGFPCSRAHFDQLAPSRENAKRSIGLGVRC